MSKTKVRGEPQESWRKWVLTMLALGFALLVITMLTQKNSDLQARLSAAEQRIQANTK